MTTLWARLALGDLFIHGIGGAKYDQVTDLLIERFFGLRPPRLLVLSATLHLPIERPRASADDARAISRELRELTYHPERFLNGSEGAPADLVAEKRRWIDTPQTAENARQRCRAIRQVNAALQPWLEGRRTAPAGTPDGNAARTAGTKSVLGWREYAFCLYPEADFAGILVGATSQVGMNML